MSDTNYSKHERRRRDVDISRPSLPTLRGNWLWLVVLLLLAGVLYITFGMPAQEEQPEQPLPPLVDWPIVAGLTFLLLLILIGFLAWILFIKRGMLTWMRLARRPAKLLAQGDAAGAEAALVQALGRARRFAEIDVRRGMMLCEIAMFVKLQGRYAEAIALYDESVAILTRHRARQPFDYFVVLNNHAICFISLKDYDAAQKSLEKALDLTLAVRKDAPGTAAFKVSVQMPLAQVQLVQIVMTLNLAFLCIEMGELAQAGQHLGEVEALMPNLSKRAVAVWHDHYIVLCALWEFESGNYAAAKSEVERAHNPDYEGLLPIRARLLRVEKDYAGAEELWRLHQAKERKKGTLHRPERLKSTLEFAECLFGQGKNEEAFAALQEARSIADDFALPADAAWRKTLETWLARARELRQAELAESLEREITHIPAMPRSGAVTILERFRPARTK